MWETLHSQRNRGRSDGTNRSGGVQSAHKNMGLIALPSNRRKEPWHLNTWKEDKVKKEEEESKEEDEEN